MAAAAAVVGAARNRVIRYFRTAEATTPANAIPAPDVPRYVHRQFEMFLRAGVVREASPGRYYLDEVALAEFFAAIRRRLLGIFLVMGLFGVIAVVVVTLVG
jgi:hypothetical protein